MSLGRLLGPRGVRVPRDPRDRRLLALDLETTGLDPARDEILGIGLVPVDGLAIGLGGAWQQTVRPRGQAGVGQSATVHGLTDDDLAAATPLAEILPVVLRALAGRVLLAHHAIIETSFLRAACQALDLPPPVGPVLDTVQLHRRVLARWRSHAQIRDDELGLAAAREHLGLPRYRAHDALTDALACAELYLAQLAALQPEMEHSDGT